MCVRQGRWELSMLLGRIRVGGLIMAGLIILVLVLAAHGGAAKKERGIFILYPRRRSIISLSEGVTWLEVLSRTTQPYCNTLDRRLPQTSVRCQVDINKTPSSI